jgi:quercetin dioxygenase-like cupin family protein
MWIPSVDGRRAGEQTLPVGRSEASSKEVHMSTTSEEIRIGQMAVRFLLEGEDSGGSVALFEFDVPAQGRVPAAHSHDAFDETIYGLEGALSWTIEGRRTEVVGPGEVLFIPRGVVHRFDNDHGVEAKMLAVASPGILGPGYFRDMASVLAAAKGGPPDPEAFGEVMRRHGLTPAL